MEQAQVADPQLVQPPLVKKPRRKRLNHALAGVLVAQGMTMPEAAQVVGAKNGESLRTSLARKGVTVAKARNGRARAEAMQAVTATVTAQVVTEAAEKLKERFNGEIVRQLQAIESVPVTYEELASRGQGRTATVKTLAEAFRSVNGSPDSVTLQFGANLLSSFTPETTQQIVPQEESPLPVQVTEVQAQVTQ